MKCRFCGRPLTSQESMDAGAGHTCLLKRQATSGQPDLFDGLPTVSNLEDDPEVIDFDKLTGRVSKKQEAPMD